MAKVTDGLPSSSEVVRDRALRFFGYLRQLAQARSRPVKSVTAYERDGAVLWLHELPDQLEVRIATRQELGESDVWLEVDRPKRTEMPEMPDVLRSFASPGHPEDPDVQPRLFVVDDVEVPSEVFRSWRMYLAAWERWAIEKRRLAPVEKLYATLFGVYQRLAELRESYELIVASGLLTWTIEPSNQIYRHLVAVPVDIERDADSGAFTVRRIADQDPMLEEEMLAPTCLPSREIARGIEFALAQAGEDIWTSTELDDCLKRWVIAASVAGTYDSSLERAPVTGSSTPHIQRAPALILRKRSPRTTAAFIGRIIEQIRADEEPIPIGIREIIEFLNQEDVRGECPSDELDDPDAQPSDDEIYFPLPSNDEQRRIVARLATGRNVVVQGPPGTGKSHTIANLVAHLLANGKRVLVTSETSRALKVLRDKIEEAGFAELCVTDFGAGRNDKLLEQSVARLAAHSNDDEWTAEAVDSRVGTLLTILTEQRQQRRNAIERLRDLLRSEGEPVVLNFGGYSGTRSVLAQIVATARSRLGWLLDRPAPETGSVPLQSEEATQLLDLLRRADEGLIARSLQTVPARGDMIDPTSVAELLDRIVELENAAISVGQWRGSPFFAPLEAASAEQRSALDHALSALRTAAKLRRSAAIEPWVVAAVDEVLAGQGAWLVHLIADGRAELTALQPYIEAYRHSQVTGLPADTDPMTIASQAHRVASHLKSGGKLRRFGVSDAIAREARSWIGQARLNGALAANSPDALDALAGVIETNVRLDALVARCSGRARVEHGLDGKASGVARVLDAAGPVVELLALRDTTAAAAASIPDLVSPGWSDTANVDELASCLTAVRAEIDAGAARSELRSLRDTIRSKSIYPSAASECAAAVAAIDAADAHSYAIAHRGIKEVLDAQAIVARRDELLARLQATAPLVAKQLAADPADPTWDARMSELAEAWDWARLDGWLEKDASERDMRGATDQLRAIEEAILSTIRQLGINMAWRQCLARLTDSHYQRLRAFVAAKQRVGKGTGKSADTFATYAREHQAAVVDAVPAWIMPTYKVAETVTAKRNAFDVVIVDEASQSGVEALYLLWLAPQVVIVGDDKQISPTTITEHTFEDMKRLVEEELGDLSLRSSLYPSQSLFDQAVIRYRHAIRLREHFRCMPEIIEFSNRLSYEDEPLIPLRQFGTDRLSPVIAHEYVPGAERIGLVNIDEAEALVTKVKELCNDPRYTDRTMGVISLVADAQARRVHQRLLTVLGPDEMDRRKLVCGNAYDFQGDDRDVMFLSLVDSPPGSGRTLNRIGDPNASKRFNVAMSRARDQVWLFHSVQRSDVKHEDLRARLLDHFEHPPFGDEDFDVGVVHPDIRREPFESLFEQRVYLKLRDRGYRVRPQVKVSGTNYRIDLVVYGGATRLAVECDGDVWHGMDRFEADLERQLVLERAGWRFFRLLESEFYRNREESLAPLWRLLAGVGIFAHQEPPVPPTPMSLLVTAAPVFAQPVSVDSPLPSVEVVEDDSGDGAADTVPAQLEEEHAASPLSATLRRTWEEVEATLGPASADAVRRARLAPGSWQRVDLELPIDRARSFAERWPVALNDAEQHDYHWHSRIVDALSGLAISLVRQPTGDTLAVELRRDPVETHGLSNQEPRDTTGTDTHLERKETTRSTVSANLSSGMSSLRGDPFVPSSAERIALPQLAPYHAWTPRPLPDPRAAFHGSVADGLEEIVGIEGPITASLLFHRYMEAAGLSRLKTRVLERLEAGAAAAVRRGHLAISPSPDPEAALRRVYYVVGTPRIVVRGRGPRELEEMPMDEVGTFLTQVENARHLVEEDSLFRAVLDAYALTRLTTGVRLFLRACRTSATSIEQ